MMNEVNQNQSTCAFYRLPKMCEMLGLSKSSIWNLSRNNPDFPKPVKLSAQCTAWRADEVQAGIDSRERVRFVGEGA